VWIVFRLSLLHANANFGRTGERISLYIVDKQQKLRKAVFALYVFVRFVPFSVNALQYLPQAIHAHAPFRKHAPDDCAIHTFQSRLSVSLQYQVSPASATDGAVPVCSNSTFVRGNPFILFDTFLSLLIEWLQ